jgi:hypothetical protein
MSTQDVSSDATRHQASGAIHEQFTKGFELAKANDRLSTAILALRPALDAADQSVGMLCVTEQDSTPQDGHELRNRWAAASSIMNAAVGTVERDGAAIAAAVKALLGL